MHYAWIVAFTGLFIVLFAHGFGRMSYSVILPYMKDALSLTYAQVGLIATGNLAGYLLSTTFGGFLASRFGPRRVISISLLVTGAGLFLTGFSHSFSFALITRLITGIGNGGCFVPTMALPAAWFVAKKRGLATGVVSAGIGTGLFLAGVSLPPVIGAFGKEGWRYAWFLLGLTVFALAFVCLAFLRDHPGEKGLSPYGAGEEGQKGPRVTLFSAFRDVVVEREMWKLGGVYFMYGFSYIIYLTFFVAYLTKEMRVAPLAAGRIFGVLGIFSIFCGVVFGWVSDMVGRRYGSMIAYFTLALSYLVFVFWKDYPGFYLSAVVFGIAAFSIPTIMAAASGDAVGATLAPAGLGFITLFFGIGQALGPVVGGYIKDATGTFTYAFLLSLMVSLAGGFGSLILKKKF